MKMQASFLEAELLKLIELESITEAFLKTWDSINPAKHKWK